MSTETMIVHIMGKDYQVACPQQEREALIKAAAELDRRMRDIRNNGSVIGLERITVMAALNLANELLQRPASSEADQQLLTQLHQHLDKALS